MPVNSSARAPHVGRRGLGAGAVLCVGLVLAATGAIAPRTGAQECQGSKPCLFMGKVDDPHAERELQEAVNRALDKLPRRLRFVNLAGFTQSHYRFYDGRLDDFLDSSGVQLVVEYSKKEGGEPVRKKGYCCACRMNAEDAAKRVVSSLLGRTLLDPATGLYELIEVVDCTVKPGEFDPIVVLDLDLNGALGFEIELSYQVDALTADVVLEAIDEEVELETVDGRVSVEFWLEGATCAEIIGKRLRMHLEKPVPCTGSQLPNKGRS